MLSEDPNRAKLRNDKEAPNVDTSTSAREAPKREAPTRDMDSPKRAKVLNDSDEPSSADACSTMTWPWSPVELICNDLMPPSSVVAVTCHLGVALALKVTRGAANTPATGAGLISMGAGSITTPSLFKTTHASAFQESTTIVNNRATILETGLVLLLIRKVLATMIDWYLIVGYFLTTEVPTAAPQPPRRSGALRRTQLLPSWAEPEEVAEVVKPSTIQLHTKPPPYIWSSPTFTTSSALRDSPRARDYPRQREPPRRGRPRVIYA
jgi:hypothetical protein